MKKNLIKFPDDQKLKNNYIKEYLNQHDNVIKQLKLESLESVKKNNFTSYKSKKKYLYRRKWWVCKYSQSFNV